MQHYMFDIDGTLIQSHEMDERCFLDAVLDVTGISLVPEWSKYPHATDRGILRTFIENQAPHYQLKSLENEVKERFVQKIKNELAHSPAVPVEGAVEFVDMLNKRDDITVSFATGGWLESALLKLASAGFDIRDITIASSNDHYSRTEIMKIASSRALGKEHLDFVYFGDGEWDIKACESLGVDLVLVGDRAEHPISISDYLNPSQIMEAVNEI